ncbi:MAG: adenylate/guanylate cyclase domain-containing protein [Pseudomonadota bacterium]
MLGFAMSYQWYDSDDTVFDPAKERRRWLPLWRPRNVARLIRSALTSFKPRGDVGFHAARRLETAERRGLQLAIMCRTLAFAVALIWCVLAFSLSGFAVPLIGVSVLFGLTALGVAHFMVIGTRFDSEALRYVTLGADVIMLSLIFALVPVDSDADAPQIYAFRNMGIYLYFPFVALASLSLSARLTMWVGTVASLGYLAAFFYVTWTMENPVSWSAIPADATRQEFDAVFLSPDFIARGSRMGEALMMFGTTCIIALAVARARAIFFAQIRAEEAREAEREKRAAISRQLGRFVPSAIAERLIADPSGLEPQVRHGAVLVLDVVNFTSYAEGRNPAEVIADLNRFLASCAEGVSLSGGVVIQFTGDGLLATLNTPIDVAEPERVALSLCGRLLACAEEFGMRVRVGVAAGDIASGSVGSDERQAFTVYGETVNRAARLEELAKQLGVSVLTDSVVAAAVPDVQMASMGEHELHGFSTPVKVYSTPLG